MKKELIKKNVTVVSTDGDVYSEIADVMTLMGYTMNHCTARNIVISVMERVVKNLAQKYDIKLSKQRTNEIASSPEFQGIMMTCLDKIEHRSASTEFKE